MIVLSPEPVELSQFSGASELLGVTEIRNSPLWAKIFDWTKD